MCDYKKVIVAWVDETKPNGCRQFRGGAVSLIDE